MLSGRASICGFAFILSLPSLLELAQPETPVADVEIFSQRIISELVERLEVVSYVDQGLAGHSAGDLIVWGPNPRSTVRMCSIPERPPRDVRGAQYRRRLHAGGDHCF